MKNRVEVQRAQFQVEVIKPLLEGSMLMILVQAMFW